MQGLWLCLLVAFPSVTCQKYVGEVLVSRAVVERAATRFLRERDQLFSHQCTRTITASWNYHTNRTLYNKLRLLAAQEEYRVLQKDSWMLVQRWKAVDNFLEDPSIKYQLQAMSVLSPAALSTPYLATYMRTVEAMKGIYSSASVCDYHNTQQCGLTPEEGVNEIMQRSRDVKELAYIWKSWRLQTRGIRSSYALYVDLANLAAQTNRLANKGELELVEYGGGAFKEQMQKAWEQLQPLYLQLHAYTRRKLRQVYGPQVVTERGPLPAHLLGDLWGHQWKIWDILVPYPGKTRPSATFEMKRQWYNPRKMFQVADDFFASLGLPRLPPSFWHDSLLQKPLHRNVICQASAWDFCNGKDFRISQCTEVREEDLASTHHETTHLQYFLHYSHLPYVYRQGANPGFQEALGNAVQMSVSTTQHLQKLRLLRTLKDEPEVDINFLLQEATDKLAFMPYAYLMDQWRWRVFDGTYKERDWNCAWWDLRYSVQGVKPPELRSEDDFDPAAKYQVGADLSFTRYFVGIVLQFQFYKALCIKAGEYDPLYPSKPLHKCDFYQSKEAGSAMRAMMQLGKSRPWPEALEALTGQREIDASAMRDYFRPLEEWLKQDNQRHEEFVGWRADNQYCLYQKSSWSPFAVHTSALDTFSPSSTNSTISDQLPYYS
ncbi:LOW QUALITY PROTEIN: angiotensin-converting enzyme [Procambarus clarkii]|uniref:LOW QUALITY PROTEIN: angiotensin-converting enzyme n=1 Tax=Procambarus clarkii TaxID=6728 RepID=UPI003742072B